MNDVDTMDWIDGWRSNYLANRFQVELKRLQQIHWVWMKIHFELVKTKIPAKNEIIERFETDHGIVPSLI
jgi:hypothetical protein